MPVGVSVRFGAAGMVGPRTVLSCMVWQVEAGMALFG